MPTLKAFQGIRYTSSTALKDLVCPPYDVISGEDQRALHARHPHNAVHLELAQESATPTPKYEQAAETFARWIEEGVLKQDREPALYVYREDFVFEGRRRRVMGAIGALEIERLGGRSGILPHEKTMPEPIEDRLALMDALPVNVSPIYAIYRGGGALKPYFDELSARPPAARLTDDGGTLHRLWAVSEPEEIDVLQRAVAPGPLVIADGHHRYETARAYHDQHAGEPGAHDAIMCFCVDADAEQPMVLPHHRALKTGIGAKELALRLADLYRVTEVPQANDALTRSVADHPFVFMLPGRSLLVELSQDDVVASLGAGPATLRSLDVVVLHEVVLPRVLPEGSLEIRFSKDASEISRAVKEQGCEAGVLLRAPRAAQIVEVARAGKRMPAKASYFWPKAVTGLVFRSLR